MLLIILLNTKKDKQSRVFFLFNLDSFKENFKQLTSLSGIKQYIKKIKDALRKRSMNLVRKA